MITYKKWKPTLTAMNDNHHIFVVDVSGSMYRDLQDIRKYLKNNLSLVVRDDDMISILYFSGKGQCGVVFEALRIQSAQDLTTAHNAIDKFLKTICLTGFKEPLALAREVADRNQGNHINNLIFMSDGYDNTWNKSEILSECEKLPESFDNATFMEYGWYADRDMLIQMAMASGGNHVFAENHELYVSEFEQAILNSQSQAIVYEVDESVTSVVYIDNCKVVELKPKEGKVRLQEHITEVYEITDSVVSEDMSFDELYIMLFLAAKSGDADKVWDTLKILGDVFLIKMYNNCFTKQEIAEFVNSVQGCVTEPELRFLEGQDKNLIPKDDAFTILDLCEMLVEGDNYLNTGSNKFKYNRIGKETKSAKHEAGEDKSFTPIFVPDDVDGLVALNNIVLNESRPNIAINTIQTGYVGIPREKVSELGLPKKVETHQYRNYTLVKDGIINMDILPVVLDDETLNKFVSVADEEGISYLVKGNDVTIDLRSMPMINRKMINSLKAEDHFNDVLELNRLKAHQKVLKYYRDLNIKNSSSAGLKEKYGEEAAAWLSEIGIRDYGFSPKVTSVSSGDFYMSRELNIKIQGLSSLPAVNATMKKINDKKKLNLGDVLISQALDTVSNDVGTMSHDELVEYLNVQTKKVISATRDLMAKLNKVTYSIVIGKKWFSDMEDYDDNCRTITYMNIPTKVTAVLESKEIKI